MGAASDLPHDSAPLGEPPLTAIAAQWGFAIAGSALWDWVQQAEQAAIAAQVPLTELTWFLEALVNLDRLALRLQTYQTQAQIPARCSLADLQARWHRRLTERVPVQYLVGFTTWRQWTLQVSPAVLIPRPETEVLIDEVEAAIAQSAAADLLRGGHWADLGTGSGAIAIGLAAALPQATLHAVDISAAALAIAQQNIHNCGLAARIQGHCGSWFEPLTPWRSQLAGMVANPPYIPQSVIATLQPEVQGHEPHLALAGGTDGLDCIRHLIHTAPAYLQSGGIWAIELMAGQAPAVMALLAAQGDYTHIRSARDLAGIDRFVLAQRQ